MKTEPNGGRIGEIAVKKMMKERVYPEDIIITKIKIGRRLLGYRHCGMFMRKVTVFYYRTHARTCPIHVPDGFWFKVFVCACPQCDHAYAPDCYY